MQSRKPLSFEQLALRAAALAVMCAAFVYLLAPDAARMPELPGAGAPLLATPDDLSGTRRELSHEVQSLLAEGGCPGWIAVANHPEWLQPAPGAKPQAGSDAGSATAAPPVRLAADRELNDVPRVKYPVPLRVASRTATNPPAPSDDPDDLLAGVEDLVTLPPVAEPADAVEPLPPTGEAAAEDRPAPQSPPPAQRQPDFNAGLADQTVEDEDELLAEEDDLLAEPKSTEPGSAEGVAPQQEAPPAEPKPRAAPEDDLLDSDDDDLLTDDDDLLEPAPKPGRQPNAADGENLPAPQPGPRFAPPPSGVPNPHAGARPAPPRQAPSRPAPGTAGAGKSADADKPKTPREQCEFIAHSQYPPATECRTCHEQIYDEWAVSSHAYAMVSPMFHKFEQKINDVAQGTIGYFCYRCHSPAGTSLGISRAAPLWDLPQVAREGVTCVACHRVNEFYGRSNGERRIVPGDVYAPVWGSIGGDGVATAVAQKDNFKVKTSPDEKGPGQPIHASAFYNPQLALSDFCITCHQVAVYPGIKLEVVWEQYRASPACKKGIRCQDCHMGRIPGVPSGFDCGPAAVVNKKNVNENRRHSNHVFYGPGYSIAHPGVFPFNPKANRWSMRDWLQFDWQSGWGEEAFEDAVEAGRIHVAFPEAWKESDDRADARDIITDNLKRRAYKDRVRKAVMENGSHVDGPFFKQDPARGQPLEFEYVVMNTNEGHNLPTASLGAQPQLWANVVLIGPRGNRLWETGYLDSLGDLADIHSVDVRNKRLAFDAQLFNLQTMFLITGAKGTDREFYLPVNVDIDQLPFIRPGAQPITVMNHPPFIRMEARSLPALGSRRVPYKIPAELLCEPGAYRLSFRMRSRLEPLYFMRFCNSTPEMQRAMTAGILDFHESSVEFIVR